MKKNVIKKILLFLIIALVIFSVYNFARFFTSGKQKIGITTSSKFYTDGNLEAVVSVKDSKKNISKKSNVKVELLNKDGKKVKDVTEKYKIDEGENANVSIPLPDDIETGSYELKITATSGILKDIATVNVSVVNEIDSNVIISLDKGIYKPGDEVNFRALITSKKDDKPVQEKVSISIYDGNDNRVFLEEAKTSEFGIVSGKFTLADEVNSGDYKLKVTTSGVEKVKNFTVNPYITPQFEASITTDKENYLIGETVKITINAKYFFGENVKNASVEGVIGEKEISGLTDENGNFTTEYKIEKSGKLEIAAQVIDSSNYLVEADKIIYGSTDIFEIEILPENNNLIKNIDNDVYIMTKKIDGTPVKTYITVNAGTLNKQVITDENGIGKLTLTADDIDSLGKEYSSNRSYIKVIAEDMEKNQVSKSFAAIIESNNKVIIKTDKVKYEQGDDIHVKLSSSYDLNEEKILVYKNDELLKMISTDQDEVIFNLEDAYGLIDIYIPTKGDSYISYTTSNTTEIIEEDVMVETSESSMEYDDFMVTADSFIRNKSNYSKKTIFINPSKKLNINIKTDSEEYKPGDELNISFDVTDENKTNVDSALMVSILDEAILNLADNDLSIDNVKLALEDIELVDGMTAADVYATVMNENQEQKLMTILLKQNLEDPNIINNSSLYTKDRDEYLAFGVISGLIAIIVIFIIASLKSKRFANGIVHFVNIIAIFVVLNLCLYEVLYYDLDFSDGIIILIHAVIAIVSYALILYKQKTILFKMVIDLSIIPIVGMAIVSLVNELTNDLISVLVFLLPPILLTILTLMSRKRALKKGLEILKNIAANITKVQLIYILLIILILILDIEYSPIACILVGIGTYVIVEKLYKKNKEKRIVEGKVVFDLTGMEIVGIIAGIALLCFAAVGISGISRNFAGGIIEPQINDSMADFSGMGMDDVMMESATTDSFIANGTTSSAMKGESIFDAFDISDSKSESAIEDSESDMMNSQEESSTYEENQEQTEENVRNVFLESLAFIPELVAQNGKAETNIKISDNITTWNIQTVGNTKEGNVGFSTSKIKVFKEFFIDFSLPTNSVVSDKTSIPVTVYNYKDTELTVSLNVKENDWCTIGNYEKQVTVPAGQTKLVYVPIEILKAGKNTLRIESVAESVQDIVEKTLEVTPNGFEKSKIIGSGTIEKDYEQDYFTTEDAIENTRNLKVKIYPSLMSQVVEGMENIFRMPTGCFEQTSSSLYPNVLALKYLESTGETNEEVKQKALDYISKGYQRILSFEVPDEKGGYSLYGDSPAEPVLTAFGLMELTDLSEVYEIEEKVLENMKDYLFKVQKVNGSFDYNSTYIGGTDSTDDLAMNAYIIWALSEACPDDKRLEKSIEYLEDKVDDIEDNYTRALVANVFVNTKNKLADKLIDQLLEQVKVDGDSSSISSNIRDYYGSYGRYQSIQTTALTSMALTKDKSNTKTNSALINYIIENKDRYGTWGTTQATVLALKAINDFNAKGNLSNQTISVKVNDEVKELKFEDDLLDIYELTFENIEKENKISVEMKKGKLYYEIVEEYYVPYEDVEENEIIKVSQNMNTTVKVNGIITQKITVENNSEDTIRNGLVQINIPQGCSTLEESLSELVHKGTIEKYEYSYGKINLYLRNFESKQKIELEVEYRAGYPEDITGGAIRVFDYYNPDIEGFAMPVKITVSE